MPFVDHETTVAALRARINDFRAVRGWTETENPKDLVMALTVEAAELQEIFSWCSSAEAHAHGEREMVHLQEEISDVLIYLLSIADLFGIDICRAVEDKLAKNAIKYPAK